MGGKNWENTGKVLSRDNLDFKAGNMNRKKKREKKGKGERKERERGKKKRKREEKGRKEAGGKR